MAERHFKNHFDFDLPFYRVSLNESLFETILLFLDPAKYPVRKPVHRTELRSQLGLR